MVIRFCFIGHRNHDEAVGTVGEAPGSIIVVESPEEVQARSSADPNKVAYVTQTTLSVSDAQRIIEANQNAFPHGQFPTKRHCYATTNRQNAVSEYSPMVDLVLSSGVKTAATPNAGRTAKEAGKASVFD